jgi:hypothetical protein
MLLFRFYVYNAIPTYFHYKMFFSFRLLSENVNVRFEVLTEVFWDMKTCSLVGEFQCFGGTTAFIFRVEVILYPEDGFLSVLIYQTILVTSIVNTVRLSPVSGFFMKCMNSKLSHQFWKSLHLSSQSLVRDRNFKNTMKVYTMGPQFTGAFNRRYYKWYN